MKSTAVAILVALLLCGSAWAQGTGASVNESLETVSLYVDPSGSDSNPGTQQLPFQTIGAAASIAVTNSESGIGTKVIINPGTYREAILLTSTAPNTLPITFEAATNGTVIVSGADVWGGWQPYAGNAQIFTNFWPYQWGECAPSASSPLQQDIVLRREMIFVNGVPLTQVLSLAEMTSPATFYVDETDSFVYLWPPSGTDMNTATVEVSTRPSLFSINGNSNMVLRGLTFQYANSCRFASGAAAQAVVVVGTSNNILFDTDNFLWNNSQGLNLANGLNPNSPAGSITVQNSVANYNGQTGFQAFDMLNVLWQNDQASYNNWRGAQGVFYSANSAGLHSYGSHSASFNNITTNLNQTYGIHWDWDHLGISTDSLVSSGDLLAAGLFEASEGPATISNSYFCNSGTVEGGGLRIRDVQSLSLANDTFYNNGTSQIMVVGTGGVNVTNWQSGQQYTNVITQSLTATGNLVDGLQGQQVFQDGDTGTADWNTFVATLNSNTNTWWNAFNPEAFTVNALSPTTYSFSGWQGLTGQDANSNFQPPSTDPSVPCEVAAPTADYWFTVTSGSANTNSGPAVFTVSVSPLGGFAGTVQLSSDGLQNIPGTSGSWSQPSIAGSGSATFTVSVDGSTPAGSYPVVLIANSGNLTHTATVMLVVNTNVSLTRTNLSFGNVQRNISVSQTVNFTNNGSTALPVSISVQPSGTAFSEMDLCAPSVAAGATCSITVTFTPSVAGPQNASVVVSDSDPSTTQTITLTGNGTLAPITLAPSSLDFGSQPVGTSVYQTVTLTNPGTASLAIGSISIIGANLADFTQANTCGNTVAPNGGTCVITATFAPTASGSRSAILLLEDNAQGTPQTVNLTGTGVTPAVTLSTPSLTFPTQLAGSSSAAQQVTLTNTGAAPLNISGIAATSAFNQTNSCGSSVLPGANCVITVTFKPTSSGTLTGSVTITDNAASSPQTISLTGTGTYVKLVPTGLNFGHQHIGSPSATKNITLTNKGRSALSITGISIVGTNLADFTETNTCGNSVPGGGTCTISVIFTPSATGKRTAEVSVGDNGGGSPQSVSLTGLGTR